MADTMDRKIYMFHNSNEVLLLPLSEAAKEKKEKEL